MNEEFYINMAAVMSVTNLPKPRKKLYDCDGSELPLIFVEIGVEL